MSKAIIYIPRDYANKIIRQSFVVHLRRDFEREISSTKPGKRAIISFVLPDLKRIHKGLSLLEGRKKTTCILCKKERNCTPQFPFNEKEETTFWCDDCYFQAMVDSEEEN